MTRPHGGHTETPSQKGPGSDDGGSGTRPPKRVRPDAGSPDISSAQKATAKIVQLGRPSVGQPDASSQQPFSQFPSGAGWVQDADSPRAAEVYQQARDNADVASRIAANTGLRLEILERVRQHLFNTEHDVQVGPNQIARGYFSPIDEIAELWSSAENGTLDGKELHRFRRLVAHEYVESQLMQSGMPYRSADPSVWVDDGYWPSPEHFGAHDLAPIAGAVGSPFGHWPRRLRRDAPDVEFADDLSNLDDIVGLILRGVNR